MENIFDEVFEKKERKKKKIPQQSHVFPLEFQKIFH